MSQFEKTNPILGKGKSKKAKGKMRVNPEFLRRTFEKTNPICRWGKMSLSIYMKGDYEEFHALRRRKNKANQSQFGYFTAEDAEYAEVLVCKDSRGCN